MALYVPLGCLPSAVVEIFIMNINIIRLKDLSSRYAIVHDAYTRLNRKVAGVKSFEHLIRMTGEWIIYFEISSTRKCLLQRNE